mgnify:CR=1 FL=1
MSVPLPGFERPNQPCVAIATGVPLHGDHRCDGAVGCVKDGFAFA